MRPGISSFAIIIFAVATTSCGPSSDANDKLCILTATRKLPFIQDLTVTVSRTKPVPLTEDQKLKLNKQYGEMDEKYVEIDVRVSGQDSTFKFLCTFDKTAAMATSLGVVR